MRFFLDVGRYTPTAGACGDMGWTSPLIRQWKCICNLGHDIQFYQSPVSISVYFFILSVQAITDVKTGHFELKGT